MFSGVKVNKARRLARFVGSELELSGRTREEERQSPAGAEEPRTGLVPASERRTNPAVFTSAGAKNLFAGSAIQSTSA